MSRIKSFQMCAATLGAIALAGVASAAPIVMTPDSVTIESIVGFGGDFTVDYDGGDTSDNVLNFTATGSGGLFLDPSIPSAALTAIVFDGTSIIAAGDTVGGGFLNPNNVVNGLAIPGTGVAAGLLLDAELASSEAFFLQLADTPTTATIYSLNIDLNQICSPTSILLGTCNPDFGSFTPDDVLAFLEDSITSQQVVFSSPVPEPSAALVFAMGLLVTARARKQR